MIDILAKFKANIDEIVYRAYLDIFGKRVFPATIGEEQVWLDHDVDPNYKGNKQHDMFKGSV